MNWKKLLNSLFTALYLFICSDVYGQNVGHKSFIWGINGHPVTQEAYGKRTWEDQLSFLKDLHVDYYRIDVPLNNAGTPRNEQNLLAFLRQLKSINVKPMLVLLPRENTAMTDSSAFYSAYYDQGKMLAKRYGAFLEVVEVGNEWDVKLVKSRKLDGTKATHYDLLKAKEKLTLLKAFIDGMKSVMPALRVSVSLGWTHWYYLDLLKQFRVNYDIIGYHWYDNMGDITNVRKPYGDFLPGIKKKYKKEIWITEFNTHAGTVRRSFVSQQQYISKSLDRILQHKVIEGFFIYELFDQPALRAKYPDEPNYGLIFKEGGEYRLKPAYTVFKTFIEKSY